ncbi:MAG: RNA recognition motif domain-containing protein [Sediminispirochaetaceae bacterium]
MNIYVGNLSYSVTDEELKGLFQEYGAVESARVIFDRMTHRSKGFGFVDMPDDGEANAAISALNGTEFMGRAMRVNQARERRE